MNIQQAKARSLVCRDAVRHGVAHEVQKPVSNASATRHGREGGRKGREGAVAFSVRGRGWRMPRRIYGEMR